MAIKYPRRVETKPGDPYAIPGDPYRIPKPVVLGLASALLDTARDPRLSAGASTAALIIAGALVASCGPTVDPSPPNDAGTDATSFDCAKLPPGAPCGPDHHCAITAGPPVCVADEDGGH